MHYNTLKNPLFYGNKNKHHKLNEMDVFGIYLDLLRLIKPALGSLRIEAAPNLAADYKKSDREFQ